MFSPITNSMEERLELIKNSMSKDIAAAELEKCESLEDFLYYSRRVESGIVAQMQIYVLENYKSVPLNIWNNTTFKITPHLGEGTMRFGKRDVFNPMWKNAKGMQELERKNYDKSIKITSISFTLDEHDGDFSVKFNNEAWSFLWGDDILTYFYTIKNHLKYLELRMERNGLRDNFESCTDLLKGEKIRKEIEKLDIKLSRYEK